ncbi:MAG TPA: hypothetical protein VIV66_18305, partial [Pyrinomonadaceae bacterium]
RFSEAESVNLILQLDEGQPQVDGDHATVRGRKIVTWIRKDKSASNDEYPFSFEIIRQGARWVISKAQ